MGLKTICTTVMSGLSSCLAVVALSSGLARSQCPSFTPPTPLDAQFHDAVTSAALALMCCGQCSNNDDIQKAANEILERLEEGYLYQEQGNATWRAYTAPNTQCGSHGHWSTNPDNGIVINTATFFDYADPCALSAILGAALAHEYVHCITLVNSRNLETGTWDDECGLWENEKLCHLIERGLIECMMSCGCAQCTGGGMQTILDRYSILHDYYLHYCDLLGVC